MIAVSSSGRSFRALAAYLVAGRSGTEQERVAWAAGRNLPTDDPELAGRFMRATADRSTRVEKPVYHLAISFDPGDPVDRATMERVADRVLGRLGLAEHEAIIVAHRDREHPHLHILVNRVHPETGVAWDRWKDQHVVQQVLREEERALQLREVPGRLYQLGESSERLPQERGVVRPPARDEAPDAVQNSAGAPDLPNQVRGAGLTSGERRQAERSGEPAFVDRVRAHLPSLRDAGSWAGLESRLDAQGLRFERRATGLVVTDGAHYVKASRVARDLAMNQLEARFAASYDAYREGRLGQTVLNLPAPEVASVRTQVTPAGQGRGPITDSAVAPHREVRGGGRAAEVARQLELYDRVTTLVAERYEAARDGSAARARLSRLEAAEARVRTAETSFERGLGSVYRDPVSARQAFERAAEAHGVEYAARTMRDEPERFGALVTTPARQVFGFGRGTDNGAARQAAVGTATAARDLWTARADTTLPAAAEIRDTLVRTGERERTAQQALGRHPQKTILEREIGWAMRQLLPRELDDLRRILTTPRLAVAQKLMEAAKDVALGREKAER